MANLTPTVGATNLAVLELGHKDAVTARLNADGSIETSSPVDTFGNNVIRLTTADSIATAIAAASTGDVIELAAGTYTLTAVWSLAKKLHFRGQGIGATTILFTNGGVVGGATHLLTLASGSAGSTFRDLTISTTGNAYAGLALVLLQEDAGVTSTPTVFRRVKFTMAGTGNQYGCSIHNLRSMEFHECQWDVTATGNDSGAASVAYCVYADDHNDVAKETNLYNCILTATNSATGKNAKTIIAAYANNYSNTVTINAYRCTVKSSTDTASTSQCANASNTATSGTSAAIINLYGCTLDPGAATANSIVFASQSAASRTGAVNAYNCTYTQDGALLYGAGNSTYRTKTDQADKNFLQFYTQTSATTGDSRGMYLRHYMAGNGGSADALRPFLTVQGTGITAAQGIHATCQIDSAKSVTGLAVGVRSSLSVTGTVTQGSLYAIMADFQGTGAHTCTNKAFMLFRDASATTKADTLFRLGDTEGELSTGTDGTTLITTGGTAGAFAGKALAVNIGGVRYYINLFAVPTT